MRTPIPPQRAFVHVAVPIVALIVAACAGGGEKGPADSAAAASPAAPDAAAPAVIDVKATDFAFDAPDTIPAGATTIRLTDGGKELHHVMLVKLNDGKTLDDFLKLGNAPVPSWAVLMGGPNAPIPGGATSEVSLMLEPGSYALTCVIPSPDGTPHIAKGMSRALTVVPSTAQAQLPASDLSITLRDYAFEFADSVAAGKHVIKVENAGAQPHEIFIAKLEAGKAPEDLAKWVEKMDGPPPGAPFGGTTAFVPGIVNVITTDLPPGDYGIFCFAPDAKDGKPHVAHGMIRRLKVA